MNLKLTYILHCINAFAERHRLSVKQSYSYLKQYQGLAFLDECYEVEHQLSMNDTLDDLTVICKRNGGDLS